MPYFFFQGVKMANIYSNAVLKLLGTKITQDINAFSTGNAELKALINKELKRANQRIKQMESSDLPSPAVKKVLQEKGITGSHKYSVYSIKGLNPNNEIEWEKIKLEYAKARSFLTQPTSTVRGSKEYINHISNKHNLPIDIGKKLVEKALEPQISESGLLKSVYEIKQPIIEIIDNESSIIKRSDFNTDEEYYKELENSIENSSKMAVLEYKNKVDEFNDLFNKGTSPRFR